MDAFHQRRIREAAGYFQLAEASGYDPALCGSRLWTCWMLLGDFESAWRESDRIAARGAPDPGALWDGEPFDGKRVVIRCLHGYGDAIQFLRYAPLVRRRARRVVVQTHPEMVGLLSRLRGADAVVTWSDACALPGGDWDQQIEVTELPRAFRTAADTIPREIPYLDIPPHAVLQSRAALGEDEAPKVGLVWASSDWNPARSMTFGEMEPLLDAGDCSFFSFQRGCQRAELALLPPARAPYDTAAHSHEIADTAAALMNMDLLITVDTMAAHLAGALGRPVWTMLPWEADWRWMLDREDTPWYPAMRLFRQPAPGDWRPVIECVAAELRKFCRKFRQSQR